MPPKTIAQCHGAHQIPLRAKLGHELRHRDSDHRRLVAGEDKREDTVTELNLLFAASVFTKGERPAPGRGEAVRSKATFASSVQ